MYIYISFCDVFFHFSLNICFYICILNIKTTEIKDGQTGSGKTYTMLGTEEDPGVNTRALDTLFTLIQRKNATHVYNLHISIVDIYNNDIRDLLSGSDPFGSDCTNLEVKRNPESKQMEISGLYHNVHLHFVTIRNTYCTIYQNRGCEETCSN